jgi:hypothetical protein
VTYPVFPLLSTAGNGTQPLETWRKGLYFKYKEPRVPLGTVCGKPTTASWLMTARRSSGAARDVMAQRAMVRWWVRGNIVGGLGEWVDGWMNDWLFESSEGDYQLTVAARG